MIDFIPPATVFILGALLAPLMPGRLKAAYMLALPVISFLMLRSLPIETEYGVNFLGFDLILCKVDRLSLVFGYIFHLITFIGILYALNSKKNIEYVSALIYAGSALGVVFAGDLLTFFAFWEMLTISALPLILASRTKAAQAAGFRYLMVHVLGGLTLLAGIIMYINEHQTIALGYIGLDSVATYCIFIGMGINAAWPFLHAWLPDAYPESTVAGAIFLSALTTKTAVYALARTFPGTEMLIWIGVLMTIFPIYFAVIENNLRRVLSYSLINQVGFMMVGIGIGTELSLNGAVAHSFAHILYKSLLFMSMGAVLYRTGKIKATELGGLYKSMPLTAIFCIIGAVSISSFPLTSGFISKSMILDAAGYGHMAIVWLALMVASVGVLDHSGIKIPFFAFFAHDGGHRVKEAPVNMLLAMGIAAFFCIFIGVYPQFLYSMLPYPVDYVPYTIPHVMSQMQLLFFGALAFTLLLRSGIYPDEIRAINLDADWFYRKAGVVFYKVTDAVFNTINHLANEAIALRLTSGLAHFFADGPARLCLLVVKPIWQLTGAKIDGPDGAEQRFLATFRLSLFTIGSTAVCTVAMLTLLLFFIT